MDRFSINPPVFEQIVGTELYQLHAALFEEALTAAIHFQEKVKPSTTPSEMKPQFGLAGSAAEFLNGILSSLPEADIGTEDEIQAAVLGIVFVGLLSLIENERNTDKKQKLRSIVQNLQTVIDQQQLFDDMPAFHTVNNYLIMSN